MEQEDTIIGLLQMKNSEKERYKLLLIGPPLGYRGGVSQSCKGIIDHISTQFEVNYLGVGCGGESSDFIKRLLRFLKATYQLAKSVKGYHILQLNPSFRINSLIRDIIFILISTWLDNNIKVAVFFHGWDTKLAQKILSRRLFTNALKYVFRKVDLIFVLYRGCKDQLYMMGVDPSKIRVTKTFFRRFEVHTETNNNDKTGILFMSRFAKDKGVETCVHIARLLVEKGYKDFKLTLAGDGPLMPMIKEMVVKDNLSKYVYIPGYVDGMEKQKLLAENDIFLLPTRLKEGCPVSIIEAMGAGMAIISTPQGGIPEVVVDGYNGFICDSEDAEDFLVAVQRLLDDKDLLRSMKQSSKRLAEQNYEAKVFMERFENALLSIV